MTANSPENLIAICGQAPFIGVPFNVPGTIQAEDFDGGGEGAAYHDTDASNNGGQYRVGAVDIENCSDSGGGYDIGWTSAGEWLEYTINAVADGQYTLQIRTASSGNAGSFHIEFDGVNKTGTITNTDSGGWQAWRTVSKTIGLTAGSHIMRLVLDSNGANGTVGNFNYFTFIASATNAPPIHAHRYSFEGAPGATLVADSVGTADGTAIGGASFTGDGRLTLNGVNGYVDLPNGIISSLINVSLETWVKWNGGSQRQRLFDFGSNSGGENAPAVEATDLPSVHPGDRGRDVGVVRDVRAGGGAVVAQHEVEPPARDRQPVGLEHPRRGSRGQPDRHRPVRVGRQVETGGVMPAGRQPNALARGGAG